MNHISCLSRIRDTLTQHRQFTMLAVLFLTFRILAVPLLAPGGFITGMGPDQLFHLNFAALSSAGYYPYLGFWSEYPPVFPWMAVLAYRLSLALPAWEHPLLLFNTALRWGFALFDLGNLILIYAIAHRLYDQDRAEWIATAYSASFAPLFVFLAWFDSLVLCFLLLGMWGMVSGKGAISGLGIGLGFLTKPFPVVVAPAAIQVFRRWPRWLTLVGTGFLVIAVVLGPLLLTSPAYTLATFRALGGNASWATVWALLDGVVDFGIVAPFNERVDPVSAHQLPFRSGLPWTWITIAFFGLGLFLWTRRIDWQDPHRSVPFVGLTLGLMLLYSKGFSPQWHLYMVTLAILCLPGWRGVLYSILLTLLQAAEWPLAYYVFRNAPWVPVVVIVLRTLAFVALTLDFAAQAFPDVQRLSRVAPMVRIVVVEIVVVTALAVTPGAIRAYRQIRVEEDPLGPLIETVRADHAIQQIVVTPQHEIFIRLAAPLRGHAPVALFPQVYGDPWEPIDKWLAEHTHGFEYVWLVANPTDPVAPTIAGDMRASLERTWCLSSATLTDDGLIVYGYDPKPDSGDCPRLPSLTTDK